MTAIQQLKIPEFILCENPIKTGDLVQDNRSFVYCPKYLSFVEVIPMDLFVASYPSSQFQKTYFYDEEEFHLVFLQNNVEIVNEHSDVAILQGLQEVMTEEKLLDLVWEYYKNYLIWEDSQIGFTPDI